MTNCVLLRNSFHLFRPKQKPALLGRIAVAYDVDAAYCYRRNTVVCLSVCHSHKPVSFSFFS